MAYHTIPAGDFFTNSPKIRIRQNRTTEDAVSEAMRWIEQQAGKGGRMNCQLYPSSHEERNGHLARLMGVQKMHAMLLELKGKTDYKLIYHKMVSPCSFQYVEVQNSLRYDCRRNHGACQTTSIYAACLHTATSGG
jgi:hypothetical protein